MNRSAFVLGLGRVFHRVRFELLLPSQSALEIGNGHGGLLHRAPREIYSSGSTLSPRIPSSRRSRSIINASAGASLSGIS